MAEALRWLRSWWARLQLPRALRRQDAMVRSAAAGDPVRLLLQDLCVAADAHGIEALTACQQFVVRTWAAHGQIANGGFDYLLQGEQPIGPVAAGYRELGFAEAAAACDRVAARVASAPGLTERERRSAARASARAARAATPEVLCDPDDSAVWRVAWEALEEAIGDYMLQHPRDFPGLADAAAPDRAVRAAR